MTEEMFISQSGSSLGSLNLSGGPSLSFQDFGRESLGILPPDIGRDSLGFLTVNRDLLSCNSIIPLIPIIGRESLDCGRESLGILNQSVLDINFGDLNTAFVYSSPSRISTSCFLSNIEKTPKIKLTTIDESNDIVFTGAVDKAFLFPSPRRPILSSTSSQNSGVPSFNSCSLEEPSKIYSLSKTDYTFQSFNNCDTSFCNSDFDNAKLISTTEIEEQRPRIKSMPNAEADRNLDEHSCKTFWSLEKPNSIKKLSRASFPGEKLDFDEKKDDIFFDSIFIEGRYIARKIADGSIFNDSNVLDSTPQPSWPSDLDTSGTNEKKTANTETVFKTIDKLLPEQLHENSSNEPKDVKGILQNLSDILNITHRSDQEKSQGQNLLSSLAELLLHGSSDSKPQNLDDSGHSSFADPNESRSSEENSDKLKSFDNMPNLSLKHEVKKRKEPRLSQSVCSTTPSIKVTKPGFKSRNSSISGLESIKNESGTSNVSSKSNDSRGSGNNLLPNKFKSKPISNVANRGPLKAVIPVKDMRRKNISISLTPEKSQQPSGLSLKSERTSTPINEPKLKPMASSTPTFPPTENKQTKVNKRKSLPGNLSNEDPSERQKKVQDSPSNRRSLPSPLTKNVPVEKSKKIVELPRYQRSSSSSSMNSSKGKVSTFKHEVAPKQDKKPIRRNSVSESNIGGGSKLKRSNSLGKETGIMSSLSKVRENLMKSAYFQSERKVLVENNNVGIPLKKMGSDPTITTVKTLSKYKISIKENAK